jgi:alpha-tubulin suppressor-like RCC1 family protein
MVSALSPKAPYKISAVSAGKSQTLALLQTGEVLGWGGAGSGRYSPDNVDICGPQSGNREPVYVGKSASFTSISAVFSDISAGYGVSVGVSTQKKLIVWGWNPMGVGGDQTISEIPTLINAVTAPVSAVAGQSIFAAIDQAGRLFTWGLNVDHALGRATDQINALPGMVHGLPVIQTVALGDNFMIVLSREGEVFSFGSNSAGQLGLGHLRNAVDPVLVQITASIQHIAVGATHVLALSNEGNVYGWGSNQYGQLGHLDKRYNSQPNLVEMPEKIAAIAAGTHFSMALAESGNVYAWGWNGFGQLGVNDTQPRSTPTKVLGLTGVQAIAAGEMHALAVGQHALYGWGSNESGQMGRAAQQQWVPYPFWKNG